MDAVPNDVPGREPSGQSYVPQGGGSGEDAPASKHHDPVTGDALSTGEWISWHVQGVIRRWSFIGLITALTILAWITNTGVVLTWWNLCASYLALFIESMVGLAMFGQTKRDAVVMREVRKVVGHLESQDEAIAVILRRLSSQDEQLVRLVTELVEDVPITPRDGR